MMNAGKIDEWSTDWLMNGLSAHAKREVEGKFWLRGERGKVESAKREKS